MNNPTDNNYRTTNSKENQSLFTKFLIKISKNTPFTYPCELSNSFINSSSKSFLSVKTLSKK